MQKETITKNKMEKMTSTFDAEEFIKYSQNITIEDFEKAYEIIINSYKNLTNNEKLIQDIYGNTFTESFYYMLKNKGNIVHIIIPSYEEICKDCNISPLYDAKTAKEWQKESNEITILDISPGWDNEYQFNNDRIGWIDYVNKRRLCECDYTKFADRIKKRNKISNRTIAGEAKKGQFIRFLSGSQSGKTGKVIDYLDDHNMMTVEVDGINKAICKTNLVEIM